jgi:ribosomal protein S6--L-glutamate ligase
MILSFNPILRADRHILCAGREPGREEAEAVRAASAVLLPQGRRKSLYMLCREIGRPVFPNYEARYARPGKLGDIRLFRELGLPHPATDLFEADGKCPQACWDDLACPVVIKGDAGGEGSRVFLAETPDQARGTADMLRGAGEGFLVQEYVPGSGRTLRVAVLDRALEAYWRVPPEDAGFGAGVGAGAMIDRQSDPELMAAGTELTRTLCVKSGIDLAGIDVIFRGSEPLLLEINYYFGRKGLGGNQAYYDKLQAAADAWTTRLGLPLPAGEFDDSLASERD